MNSSMSSVAERIKHEWRANCEQTRKSYWTVCVRPDVESLLAARLISSVNPLLFRVDRSAYCSISVEGGRTIQALFYCCQANMIKAFQSWVDIDLACTAITKRQFAS
jgi:hypothetical protein